jgi:hypothetical protein
MMGRERVCGCTPSVILPLGFVRLGCLYGTLSIFRPGTEHLRAKPASLGKREELLPVDECCCRLSQGQVAGAYRFRCATIQLPDLHRGAEYTYLYRHQPSSSHLPFLPPARIQQQEQTKSNSPPAIPPLGASVPMLRLGRRERSVGILARGRDD